MLTEKQQKQLNSQLEQHRHNRYEVDIVLTDGYVVKDFVVHPMVLRPEKMSALYLARWLFFNNGIYKDKVVLDMGSGSGIQGVVMSLYGAKKVTFSDLSPMAVKNTEENVEKYGLKEKSLILESDLFEKVQDKLDIIVFNHPFFSDSTIENLVVSSSMLDRGKLIHRFFDDVPKYLNKGGLVIMPYFHVAGPVNDPGEQAPKHGYVVSEKFRVHVKNGLQKGNVSIYEITVE